MTAHRLFISDVSQKILFFGKSCGKRFFVNFVHFERNCKIVVKTGLDEQKDDLELFLRCQKALEEEGPVIRGSQEVRGEEAEECNTE